MKKLMKRILAVGILCVLMLGSVSCSVPDDENQLSDITKTPGGSSGELNKDAYNVKIDMIRGVLEKYYMGDIDYDKATEGIYAGFIDSLGDPYTVYFSAEEYKKFSDTTNGNYAGVGSTVTTNAEGYAEFVKPFKDGPAYNAGVLPGDIIYEIDGENMAGVDLDTVVSKVRGEAGTTVKIKVYRKSTKEYLDITITRGNVQTPTVEYQMFDGGIGYVIVTEFDKVTESQFNKAIDDLTNQGMKALIVDLRDNPGGMLTTVVSMLSRILPKDLLLIYMEDKDGKREEHFSNSKKTVDVPIAVLINGNSASASEVFAGCLQDYEKATLIGTKSFGKGIVQSLIPLGDGSALKITTSKYFSPKGRNIHGVGFEPDIKVELDPELKGKASVDPAEDNQVQAAVDFLKTQIK
ncbi:MAG: S41 family peptidase [Lachnospiraceae bacterium]|nr:S41 family peptidase [Lachnospiraceae bacterium]